MDEKCKNCKFFSKLYVPPLKAYEYVPNGYCCTFFAPDGEVMWLGANEEEAGNGMCEMFTEREELHYD